VGGRNCGWRRLADVPTYEQLWYACTIRIRTRRPRTLVRAKHDGSAHFFIELLANIVCIYLCMMLITVAVVLFLVFIVIIRSDGSYINNCTPKRQQRQLLQVCVLECRRSSTGSSSHGNANTNSTINSDREFSSSSRGVRLNKVFKAKYSRRVADSLIASGRVSINGNPVRAKGGTFVFPFKDIIKLDGKVVTGWEEMNSLEAQYQSHKGEDEDDNSLSLLLQGQISSSMDQFEYIKYYKPLGVTCTTDIKVKRNIIDEVTLRNGLKPRHRIYPVGRLDKDTTGLIILTSDGRLPNASLRLSQKQSKTYHITLDKDISDKHMQKLRDGIVITTVAQRDRGVVKPLTARTKPCIVERSPNSTSNNTLIMTIMEGRNRQIRKMLEALNFDVVALKRINFAGITLDGLKSPGQWRRLNKKEMKIIEQILEQKT
jgi:23S rRNA pseudouridine2604 synthase